MKALQRILHVEDEADIREIVVLALEMIGGFTVESCSSGQEALEKAPNFAPDIILMDIMMPGMDGPETYRQLQQIPDIVGIPVIFMTAKVQSHEVDEYIKLGGVGVISKPFDPTSLSKEIVEIWESLNDK